MRLSQRPQPSLVPAESRSSQARTTRLDMPDSVARLAGEAGVLIAVAATAAAGFIFTWLRRRSGSLLAPIALHWSLNGMGALAAALVWHLAT